MTGKIWTAIRSSKFQFNLDFDKPNHLSLKHLMCIEYWLWWCITYSYIYFSTYSIVFDHLQACTKKRDIDQKMLSAVLTGVNRAYPFAKGIVELWYCLLLLTELWKLDYALFSKGFNVHFDIGWNTKLRKFTDGLVLLHLYFVRCKLLNCHAHPLIFM